MVRLRRQLALSAGITTTELGRVVQVHYLKVAELQRRGLVHFHALLRADGAEGPESEPPTWLTVDRLETRLRSVVRSTRVNGLDGPSRCWGSQIDVSDLSSVEGDDRRIAGYLAKYATKTTDGTVAFARPFTSRREIERLQTSQHLRRLALTAWRLGGTKDLRALRLREHAHTFGYRGQLITKSRRYSTTFASLRGARVEFRARRSHEDPIEGSFNYEGRGYDDPDAARLAEMFFEMLARVGCLGTKAHPGWCYVALRPPTSCTESSSLGPGGNGMARVLRRTEASISAPPTTIAKPQAIARSRPIPRVAICPGIAM